MPGLSSRLVAGEHTNMISEETNRCAEICDQFWRDKAPPTNFTYHGVAIDFTDSYTQGWIDACKACASVIRGKEPI